LHTFFSLAQFCNKPCNPVLNVLQFFKKANNVLLVLHCQRTRFALQAQVLNPQPPSGNVALTTGIPSGTKDYVSLKT
jgi:hypothetical protein